MNRSLYLAVALLICMVGLGQLAFADTILVITDGTGDSLTWNGTTLTQTGTASATIAFNPIAGAYTIIGSVGNWTFNNTTGQGTPAQPLATLDLNSVDDSSSSGGNLTLWFSQNNNTLSATGFDMAFGGTITNGTATYTGFESNTNTLLATTTQIGQLGPFGPVAFSGTTGGAVSVSNPYSLTQKISLTSSGTSTYSGDASLDPVPEPASLALFGSGLLGLAGFARRRFVKS